jgi:pimeloyl-ACP methyl ester carboxylesterase
MLLAAAGCSGGAGSDVGSIDAGASTSSSGGANGSGSSGGANGSGSSSGSTSGSGSGGNSSSSSSSSGAGSGSGSSSSSGGNASDDAGSSAGNAPGADAGSGASLCGAPLDGVAPTATSIASDGPYAVTSYTAGLPASSDYAGLTVFYPTNFAGPYVVVMVSPGLTEILAYLQPWAQRFASYGYVAVFVAANDTNADSEATRATGLWSAIGSIQAENTRSGSPLEGKLSGCIVTSGHSLGGGASLTIANTHPTAVKAALGFNPYDPTQVFSNVVAPTLILTGQDDPTAPPAQHGLRQYGTIPSTVLKEYVEITGGNHQSALLPQGIPGPYAVAWIKYNVDGDARYKPFLATTSGLSGFQTTLP